MYITLEADYAVRIVDAIARNRGRMMAEAIAAKSCITAKHARKILHKLSTCGIILSRRGTSGGYELAKQASDITIHDVLYAIEGPLVLNRCLLENTKCTRVPDKNCPYHHTFARLTDYIHSQLSSLSFADVINMEK